MNELTSDSPGFDALVAECAIAPIVTSSSGSSDSGGTLFAAIGSWLATWTLDMGAAHYRT